MLHQKCDASYRTEKWCISTHSLSTFHKTTKRLALIRKWKGFIQTTRTICFSGSCWELKHYEILVAFTSRLNHAIQYNHIFYLLNFKDWIYEFQKEKKHPTDQTNQQNKQTPQTKPTAQWLERLCPGDVQDRETVSASHPQVLDPLKASCAGKVCLSQPSGKYLSKCSAGNQ